MVRGLLWQDRQRICFDHGTMRWTGLPLIATFQVVTSSDVPVPVIVYWIFHQPDWRAV